MKHSDWIPFMPNTILIGSEVLILTVSPGESFLDGEDRYTVDAVIWDSDYENHHDFWGIKFYMPVVKPPVLVLNKLKY